MNFYLFILPIADNAGRDYAEAHRLWTYLAGDYTVLPGLATGVWVDEKTGQTYKERVVQYQVACDPEKHSQLVKAAFDFFPDQKAIFSALVGAASIQYREERHAAG